jgi:hypothetical protein
MEIAYRRQQQNESRRVVFQSMALASRFTLHQLV